MEYISTLKELFKNSWMLNWDGLQKSYIKTCNRFFKKHYTSGKDSALNIVLVKLAIQYDYEAFVKALIKGITFDYQTYNYTLIKNNRGRIDLIVTHLTSEKTTLNHSITYGLYNGMVKTSLNNDIIDIIEVLLSKGI